MTATRGRADHYQYACYVCVHYTIAVDDSSVKRNRDQAINTIVC